MRNAKRWNFFGQVNRRLPVMGFWNVNFRLHPKFGKHDRAEIQTRRGELKGERQ